MVRLCRAHRDERIGASLSGVAAEKFQLPNLVPAHAEAGKIVALDEQVGAAR